MLVNSLHTATSIVSLVKTDIRLGIMTFNWGAPTATNLGPSDSRALTLKSSLNKQRIFLSQFLNAFGQAHGA